MPKAKRVKKAPKEKVVRTSYFGFNITLRSKYRKGTEAYVELIDAMANLGYAQIPPDKAITLRTKFVTKVQRKEVEYEIHYGKITRFTLLDGNNWLNLQKRDFENFQPPANIYPNAVETDYVFIPAAHRFFIKSKGKISVQAASYFLASALRDVTNTEEQITVSIIQSQDVIEQIIEARNIKSLHVVVSYTNDDIGDEADEFVDELLKKSNVGVADVVFRPDQKGELNADGRLIRGFLGVAKENGFAEASIINNDGKRDKIVTTEHPEKIKVTSKDEGDSKKVLFNQIIEKYRNENANDADKGNNG